MNGKKGFVASAKVKQPHPMGNPGRAPIEALREDKVNIHQRNVAMKMLGHECRDNPPFSRIVAPGIGAIIELEKSGYMPITS